MDKDVRYCSRAEVKVCICLQIARLPEDITGSTAARCISLSVHSCVADINMIQKHIQSDDILANSLKVTRRSDFMLSSQFRP